MRQVVKILQVRCNSHERHIKLTDGISAFIVGVYLLVILFDVSVVAFYLLVFFSLPLFVVKDVVDESCYACKHLVFQEEGIYFQLLVAEHVFLVVLTCLRKVLVNERIIVIGVGEFFEK